jgi:hypothetical protein
VDALGRRGITAKVRAPQEALIAGLARIVQHRPA